MHHHGQSEGFRDVERSLYRDQVVRSGLTYARTDLHAKDQISMLLDGLNGTVDVGVLQVFELSPQIGDHTCGGDVQERANSGGLHLDDILPKAGEGLGPGGSGIQDRGGASAETILVRVDAIVGNALESMGVKVDQAGRHDSPARLDDLPPTRSIKHLCDVGDTSAPDADVIAAVQSL